MGQPQRDCWEVNPLHLPAILQGLERQICVCLPQRPRPHSPRRISLVLGEQGKEGQLHEG